MSTQDAAWLSRYEAQQRPYIRGKPSIRSGVVLGSVTGRLGVTPAQLRRARGSLQVVLARGVAALALRMTGHTHKAIGKILRRNTSSIHHVEQHARGFPEAMRIAREVVEIARRGSRAYVPEPPIPPSAKAPRAGETYTITGVVGDALWIRLDRWAESEEMAMEIAASRERPPPFGCE